MYVLEALQSCHIQQKYLLSIINRVHPSSMNFISFDSDNYEPRLPPSVTFMLTIGCLNKNICQTFRDEGTTICIMSLLC